MTRYMSTSPSASSTVGVPASPTAHASSSPRALSRCGWKRLLELCYSQLLTLFGVSVVLSMYLSTRGVIAPISSSAPHDQPTWTATAMSRLEAQNEARRIKEEALAKMEREAHALAGQLRQIRPTIKVSKKQEQTMPKEEEIQRETINRKDNINKNDNSGDDDDNSENNKNSHDDETDSEDTPRPVPAGTGLVVDPTDWIYTHAPGEAAPVVVEQYKLIFFNVPKVGCTVWKMLFRRMMGYLDWQSIENGRPHRRDTNGLVYLNHYTPLQAAAIMTDPAWTRAVFVRDPKERFLSAYMDKAVEEQLFYDTCCFRNREVFCKTEKPSLAEFLIAIHSCHDSHWDPQSTRMEAKYWPYINFVGHMEHLKEDAEALLKRLGAWEKYGKSGWGDESQSLSIFEGEEGRGHAQNARHKVEDFFYPALEQAVERFYAVDYDSPYLNLTDNRKYAAKQADSPSVDVTTLQPPHFVEPRDWIYRTPRTFGSESSPVVIEEYKLVFFVTNYNARNYFKGLLRRMMGLPNWNKHIATRDFDGDGLSEEYNEGLVFLRDFNLSRASEIMTSPNWTRAMFVRDPKDRFVMAYSQSVRRNRLLLAGRCCLRYKKFCVKNKLQAVTSPRPTVTDFIEGIFLCKDPHWDTQVERIAAIGHPGKTFLQKQAFKEFSFHDNKYWKYLNFIGHMETVQKDTKELLEKVGAWEKFGKTGWGENDEKVETMIFTDERFLKYESQLKDSVKQLITSATVEQEIDDYLEPLDYSNAWLNLPKRMLYPNNQPANKTASG